MIYGAKIESEYRELRDVLTEPKLTNSGNIVMRVGREIEPGGRWESIGYVVLTPDEATSFAHAVLNLCSGGEVQS